MGVVFTLLVATIGGTRLLAPKGGYLGLSNARLLGRSPKRRECYQQHLQVQYWQFINGLK